MTQEQKIPDPILKEISLYVSPGEKVVGAISSASGPVGKIGELWMILTDLNVLFHTREYGKEPVVALIPRKDLQIVKYEQHAAGTTLVFVPRNHPKNIVKVPFPKIQRPAVNKFCEELAKTVPFELVGTQDKPAISGPASPTPESAVRAQTPSPSASSTPGPTPASAAVTPSPTPGPSAPAPAGANPAPTPSAAQTPTPSPAPARGTPTFGSPAGPTVPATVAPPSHTLSGPSGTAVKVAVSTQARPAPERPATEIEVTGEPPDVKYIVLATLISVLVGFFWYYFFRETGEKA